MQTQILDSYLQTAEGKEAESILRSCVHCGFCTATCPTYQLLGDELDGPRGRIYLMKQLLEGKEVTRKTKTHLDRCLTCRSCETTCPSGVRYGRLVDIGRDIVEHQVRRPLFDRVQRKLLRVVIPRSAVFKSLLNLGRLFKPVLPTSLKQKIPVTQKSGEWPTTQHTRKMLVLDGCVQPVTTPRTNAATARVLDRLGIQLVSASGAGCCGALSHHLSAHEEGLDYMRRNIDAWWPHIDQGVEAIINTASGCGVVVKDYGMLLANDTRYADKAKHISELAKDLSEILSQEDLSVFARKTETRVAFHSPCSLQHGQKITGTIESILRNAGFVLTEVSNPHLCCGSAGAYSILQTELSQQLLDNKLDSLQSDAPDVIVSANVGCQMHMATKASVPVRHWVELLDDVFAKPKDGRF
ncbi:MAG: glycolate oxidase subunit GlcF [Gammaproteobacteria bacterium]|nr:glycolate oxidase subunit GlcF [Gammaproteobacteria bacterium]